MKQKKWTELDDDAKEQIAYTLENDYSKIHEKYPDTSIAEIKQDLEDLANNPQYSIEEGQKADFKIGGMEPTAFTMGATSITYFDAFCELIDGVLENHKRTADSLPKKDANKLKTKIEFELVKGGSQLLMKENSGGIRHTALESVAKIGDSGWGDLYGVGVFGVGLKKAMRKISTEQELFTWHEDDAEPRQVKFDSDYWAEAGLAKTEVFVDKGKATEKGSTFIRFNNLNKYPGETLDFNDKFLERLGMAYELWNNELPGEIEISFKEGASSSKRLPKTKIHDIDQWKKDFSFHPGYEPRVFTKKMYGTKKNGKEMDLEIKLTFGMRKVGNPDQAGVYVYGNNRLFHGPQFTGNPGVGQELWWGFGQKTDYGKIKSYSSENYKFIAFIEIKAANPIDIPWNTSHKNGYNYLSSTIHNDIIAKMVQCAAKPYMDFIQATKNPETEHFDINGIHDVTDTDFLKKFVPVSQSLLKTQKGKKAIKIAKEWKPRLLFDDPIDFDKISTKGSDYGHWNNDEMKTIFELVKHKMKSGESGDVDDFTTIETLFDYYTKPTTASPKASTTRKRKWPPTSKKTTAKTTTTTKPAKAKTSSVSKAKTLARTKLSQKAESYGGSMVPSTLDKFHKISEPVGLPKEPVRAEIEHLMAHFLMTSDLYDDTVLPKPSTTSKNFDEWIKGRKWTKKAGSKYDLTKAEKTAKKKKKD